MRTRYLAAILSTLLLWSSACETSKPADTAPTPPPTSQPAGLDEGKLSELIARAEAARDRELQARPTFKVVEKIEEAARPAPTDRRLLREQLFGLHDIDEDIDEESSLYILPYAQIAHYNREANEITYTRSPQDGELLDLALIAALVSAIDAQNTEAPEAATSWDQALTRSVASQATVHFAMAAVLLSQTDPDASMDLLAERPELATTLPYMSDWMAFEAPKETTLKSAGPDALRARLARLVSRQAWQLAAALYRSNGWSGVELANAIPPTHSADIVRPDRWMRGAPVGRWSWPEEAEKLPSTPDSPASLRRGTVGPALMSIWLEDVVDARLAQSIYAGYLSDSYRYFEPSESQKNERFEWLTLWDSPSSATQVAAAFEKRLRERFRPRDADTPASGRFSVFADGLIVGIIIEKGADTEALRAERRARAEHLLGAHSLELMPRTPLPTKFVPTRRDAFAASAQASTLKDRVWEAPELNLRIDLNPLGDAWRVQRPDAGTLRWFATHEDGALLQLTVELNNPLGPAFESDAYRTQLGDALGKSLQDATVESLKKTAPKDTGALKKPGISLRLRGVLNQEARALQIWQFQRADTLITYSLQSPPESFAEHLKKANAILEASTMIHAPDPAKANQDAAKPAKTDADPGRIEYHIED